MSYIFSHDGKEKKKEEQNQNFMFNFLCMRRIKGTLGRYFTLVKLRVFVYKRFAFLCSVCLGAAPIQVQDAISVYLRSAIPYL